MKEVQVSTCPECGSELELGREVIVHEIIDCSACGVELEVVSLDPIKIELAPQEEEDWGE